MSQLLPPLRLIGAQTLRDGVLAQRSVAISGGRITKGPLPAVDLSGYLILPGIIDMHGDAFERHVAPRRSAAFDLAAGLASADRDAAANGVTTAWFAQSWSWEGSRRSPAHATSVMEALALYRRRMLTDIRLQLRCETHMVDSGPQMIAAIERFGIDCVVFNNHLPDAVEMQRTRPADFAIWARELGHSAETLGAAVDAVSAAEKRVPRHLCDLAEAFDRLGVLYGSHDDPDGETRERFSMIGARIAEFPTTRRAAAAAKAMNSPVLMGAPNVVRGKSQAGNIAARDLIAEGLCDALVSDYYYPALAQAAWRLVDEGVLDLARAWAMISSKPADIMRLADRGVIAMGKRADLTIVNAQTRAIEATICGGKMTYMAGGVAARFFGMPQTLSLAAE